MKCRFFPYGGLAAMSVMAAALAMAASAEAQSYTAAAPSVSTPHMADGKPDLTGMWRDAHATAQGISISKFDTQKKDENGNSSERFASRRCGPTEKGFDGQGCFEETNESEDAEFIYRLDPNRPLYKPEYWDKVQDLDYNTNTKDPIFTCMPLGVPRMGAPTEIVQTDKYAIFFYAGYPANQFRIIPIDGRGHDPVRAKDISYFGDSVGHWDGDTLVVDAVGFNDATWIASGIYGRGGGYFHSYDMRVTERFRRDGNQLHYQVTVDDPTVLLEPWTMNPKELQLNPDLHAYLQEGDQCSQGDPAIVVTKIRH